MDQSESHGSSTPNYSLPGYPPNENKQSGSGLTLVLPPLKTTKLAKNAKKAQVKGRMYQGEVDITEEKRVSRPVKLKPLREVLMKLIIQIKKKDDYAFFLQPVDASKVPGYSDTVKQPMDFGTMTTKVARGRYRTLDDFTSDFKLVTSNAKLFNPPGTIYYTEAERIETWGLEHIAKVAPTVIQHETDWNIDENDEDGNQVNIDDDDADTSYTNVATPVDVDENPARLGRSPSVASQQQLGSRRGLRGQYKKVTTSNTISETIDADGRLPGSKDGLGAFPPGSDWADIMLTLKLKGKKYKTKKERMRFEKEGPPYCPDGSLDYSEMEDPFSILSALVPDPLSRPHLTALFPPVEFAQPSPADSHDPHALNASYHGPVTLPLNYSPQLSTSSTAATTTNYRHWTITRSGQVRVKAKDKDDGGQDDTATEVPAWQVPHEPSAIDFGALAVLSSEIDRQMQMRKDQSIQVAGMDYERMVLNEIRNSLVNKWRKESLEGLHPIPTQSVREDYWTDARAIEAEEYIQDVVYGGIDGLAYVRSLAEFVAPIEVDSETSSSSRNGLKSISGVPLVEWVLSHVIDPLTLGRHALLRQAALELSNLRNAIGLKSEEQDDIARQVSLSLHRYPTAHQSLSLLRQITTHQIDMSALIHKPGELFLSEEELAGTAMRSLEGDSTLTSGSRTSTEPLGVDGDINSSFSDTNASATSSYPLESPEAIDRVLNYNAGIITRLDSDLQQRPSGNSESSEEKANDRSQRLDAEIDTEAMDTDTSSLTEDSVLRDLRLSLLALAKRAPLNTIARLPKDLVPENIRHFVPTLDQLA